MRKFYSFLILICIIWQNQFAQTDSVKAVLSEIVTTANRIATPYYALGSSVSIVTSETIAQKQLRTIVDVLREVPGISVIQQGGPGKLTYVSMRGANTNHTLVFVDGIKLNDPSSPSNAFDFSSLNTNDIERIEIVRGPQTTIYGSDAIAGVINIITKHGSNKNQFTIQGEGGTNNYYRSSASLTGEYGLMSYAFMGSQNGTDGISASSQEYGNTEKDGFINTSITSKINLKLPADLQLGVFYKFNKTKADLDQSEKLGDDPNFTMKQEEQIWRTDLHSSFFTKAVESVLSFSHLKRFSNTIDYVDKMHPSTSSNSYNDAGRSTVDWQNTLNILPYNLFVFGFTSENESANTSYISESEWGPFTSEFPNQSITTTSFYLQDQLNISNTFFASLGLRNDKNTKYGSKTTFRIVPAYFNSATNTKIKFSYGTGFKAPSLFYLFDPMFGNPELKPETSIGYDFGIEQFLSNPEISFGITYFNLKLENMFGMDSNFKTVNILKASSKGVEIDLSIKPISNLSLNASYTFNQTRDENIDGSNYGDRLLRRPKHQFSVCANYQMNNDVNINIQINHVGRRDDNDYSSWQAKRIELMDYTLVTLAANYQLLKSVQLNARVENLLDKKYEEVLYYGTLGRTFYAGLNFIW